MRTRHSSSAPQERTEGRASWTATLAAALLVLPACAVANTDVEAEDDSVFFPGGRVSWSFAGRDPGEVVDGAAARAEGPGPSASLELDLSYGEGSGEQSLGPGQVVVLGGGVFTGPTDFEVFFDLTRALLDVRMASGTRHGVSVEGFGGLEYSSMSVDLRQGGPVFPARTGSDRVTAIGPTVGAALVWQPIGALRFSAEGRAGIGFSSEVNDVELRSLDLGLSLFPSGTVSVFAGWRTVRYQADAAGSSASDLDLELAGPVLALWVRL